MRLFIARQNLLRNQIGYVESYLKSSSSVVLATVDGIALGLLASTIQGNWDDAKTKAYVLKSIANDQTARDQANQFVAGVESRNVEEIKNADYFNKIEGAFWANLKRYRTFSVAIAVTFALLCIVTVWTVFANIFNYNF